MKPFWKKRKTIKRKKPLPPLDEILAPLYNKKKPPSYKQLTKIRIRLLDIWLEVKNNPSYEQRWHNGFNHLMQLLTIQQSDAFLSGDISWRQCGAINQSDDFLIENTNVQQHRKDWIRVKTLPHGNVIPSYNGRPVSIYKLDIEQTIYFGFDEVSNGCFCYWHRDVR